MCAIQFRFEIDEIQKTFGREVPVLAGGVTVEDAKQIITNWNEGKIPLLLVHPASVAHGLNLQAGGSVLIFFALTWSLEQHYQLIRRLYRQGQKRKTVVVHYFIFQDTVDNIIFNAIQSKDKNQNNLLEELKNGS